MLLLIEVFGHIAVDGKRLTNYAGTARGVVSKTLTTKPLTKGIGFKNAYSSGIKRRPYFLTTQADFWPFLRFSKRCSTSSPVIPT